MGRVKLGHAFVSETNGINGTKGDQTGNELRISDWYLKSDEPWTAVFRWKDAAKAERYAEYIEDACASPFVGYGQSDRTTFDKEAEKVKYEIAGLKVNTNTDCSALVASGCRSVGLSVSRDMYTGNEKAALEKTGEFEVYTSDEYCLTDEKLLRGDILLKKGHTATVLTNGSALSLLSGPLLEQIKPKKQIGTAVVKENVNVRTRPSTDGALVTSIAKGKQYKVYAKAENGWLFTSAGGWSSGNYLEFTPKESSKDSEKQASSTVVEQKSSSSKYDSLTSAQKKAVDDKVEDEANFLELVVGRLLDDTEQECLVASAEWLAFKNKFVSEYRETLAGKEVK